MIKDINDDDLRSIYKAIGAAISDSLAIGKDEPNKIAQLTYSIPKNINGLNLTTKGYSLSVGGVFIHQRPYVIFDSSKTVELGDLLLISTVMDSKSGINRRAILLQAKMFDDLPTSPDNKNQHELYNQWPAFQYKAKYLHTFNNGNREINDLDIHSSAKYLLLSRSRLSRCIPICLWHRCGALTAQPTLELSHHACFIEELLQFVLGDRGKEFVDKSRLSTTEIGWSRVVNDLLEAIAKKTTKKMKNPFDNPAGKRSSGVFSFGRELSFLKAYTKEVISFQSDGNGPPNNFLDWPENSEDDGGGISVIEFVLRKE